MRRIIALILAFILLTPLLGEVSAAENPQPVFKIDIVIKAAPVAIGNSSTWLGTFKMRVVLVEPSERAYFENLAAQNKTLAEEEFRSLVEALVYRNLKRNLEKRFEAAGLNSTIYLPSGGPVKVLDNWSAAVTFAVSNFMVSDGKVIRCPISGPMDFVYKGKVYDYSWERLTLILPKDYEIKNLAPTPSDLSDNVAVWENGNFIPLVELYTPVYSYVRFLNATHKEISLQYDPQEGYVQFNATFTGAKATQSIISQLLASFRGTMDIISIDTRQEENGLVVIGVAKPDVTYQETSSERVWKAMVKLPGRFDSITVVGGEYIVGPDNTVIITVTESKPSKLPYIAGAVVLVAIAAVFLMRGRRQKKAEEPGEVAESGDELSEEVEEDEQASDDAGGE